MLGAWGLGWEVWCDGQEITQFTYFQQAGGQPLAHPAIEITYGLERILMALQVRQLTSCRSLQYCVTNLEHMEAHHNSSFAHKHPFVFVSKWEPLKLRV